MFFALVDIIDSDIEERTVRPGRHCWTLVVLSQGSIPVNCKLLIRMCLDGSIPSRHLYLRRGITEVFSEDLFSCESIPMINKVVSPFLDPRKLTFRLLWKFIMSQPNRYFRSQRHFVFITCI